MINRIRECTIDDLEMLCEVASRTYNDTFRDKNTLANMQAYLDKAFNTKKIRDELMNEASVFYFLYCDEELVGYMKLNEYAAQTDVHDPKSIELERIYVLSEFQGSGYGKGMVNKAIEIAKKKEKEYIWLGVWEENSKAISFYEKNGFNKVDKHSFFMGEEEQTDYIMRRNL